MHPSRYSESDSSQQLPLSPDRAEQWKIPGTSEPVQNLAGVQPVELRSQDGQNRFRRAENHSDNAAKPGSRDDNIRSTLAETPNSRSLPGKLPSGRSSKKHLQSTKGTSTKQTGQVNYGGRLHDTFGNEAEDPIGQILDGANSTSVDTEVVETIAPGKFSIRYVMC